VTNDQAIPFLKALWSYLRDETPLDPIGAAYGLTETEERTLRRQVEIEWKNQRKEP